MHMMALMRKMMLSKGTIDDSLGSTRAAEARQLSEESEPDHPSGLAGSGR